MLRINTEIILDNGIVINWLLLNLVSIRKSELELTFDTFTSKDLLIKSVERKIKIKENLELAEKFKEMVDNKTFTDKDELNELQSKINKLSDEVDNLPDYNEVVISNFSVTIPYSHKEKITKDFIIEQLKKYNYFNIISYE